MGGRLCRVERNAQRAREDVREAAWDAGERGLGPDETARGSANRAVAPERDDEVVAVGGRRPAQLGRLGGRAGRHRVDRMPF
jgi:hypothetical protein